MRKCKINNCDGKHKGLGFCSKHYKKWKYDNDPIFRAKDIANKAKWLKIPANYANHAAQNLANMKKRYHNNETYRASEQERTKHFRRNKYHSNEEFRAKESLDAIQRKKLIKCRTPKWANLEAIRDFYKNRPNGYHVDHIIPLKGKEVSGLHVLENLQYLPAQENLKKSNNLEDSGHGA